MDDGPGGFISSSTDHKTYALCTAVGQLTDRILEAASFETMETCADDDWMARVGYLHVLYKTWLLIHNLSPE